MREQRRCREKKRKRRTESRKRHERNDESVIDGLIWSAPFAG